MKELFSSLVVDEFIDANKFTPQPPRAMRDGVPFRETIFNPLSSNNTIRKVLPAGIKNDRGYVMYVWAVVIEGTYLLCY